MSTPYRALYDALRKQDERNYAKDHSFDEWLDWHHARITQVDELDEIRTCSKCDLCEDHHR